MLSSVLELNNTLHTDPLEVVNIFAHNLSDISRGLQSPPFLAHKLEDESSPVMFPDDDGSDYNVPFRNSVLTQALQRCSNTAPGADNIHYTMVKHLPDSSTTFLLDLFNKVWSEGSFSSFWRLAIVLPFLKPHKDYLL